MVYLAEQVKVIEKPRGLKTHKMEPGFILFSAQEIEEMAKPREARPVTVGDLVEWVCSKCMNSTHEVCLYHCREKKDYSAFVTKPKEQWEEVPRLPPNGEMMAWPASARLAAFRVVLDVLTELVDGK